MQKLKKQIETLQQQNSEQKKAHEAELNPGQPHEKIKKIC